jgi:diguanylate cyclase (GGDEF)-like protein/PAS domain S-box-containing protein
MPRSPIISGSFLHTLLESIDEMVIVTEIDPIDLPGPTIVYVNKAFTDISGYTFDEAVGQSPRILQGPGTDRKALDRIRRGLQEHRECREEVLNYHKNGTSYWLHMHIVPLPDESGKVRYFGAIERDITAQRNQTERLLHLAHRDVLTGLPNRGALEEEFSRVSTMASARGHALVLLDLDEFKQVNDTYGHLAGDELLRMFAALLLSNLRRDDFVARLGGDEFVILLPDTRLDDAQRVAQQIVDASLELEIKNNDQVEFGASAGVTALLPGEELSSALARADKALYSAKSGGKGMVKIKSEKVGMPGI